MFVLLGKLQVVALVALAVAGLQGSGPEGRLSDNLPPGQWQDAPEYVWLFAPRGERGGAYRAWVSPEGLDAALGKVRADQRALAGPGSWIPMALLPLDAFGLTGRYDRGKLTRVYGATRARVARGPVGSGRRPTQSWTLISPYPSPSFDQLRPGTLLISLDLP